MGHIDLIYNDVGLLAKLHKSTKEVQIAQDERIFSEIPKQAKVDKEKAQVDKENKNKEAAATMIQSQWRGKRDRKAVAKKKEDEVRKQTLINETAQKQAETIVNKAVAEAAAAAPPAVQNGGGVSEEVTMLGKYALLAKQDREKINTKIDGISLDSIKDSTQLEQVIPVFHELQKYFEGSKDLTEIIAILKTNEKDEIKKPINIELTEIIKDPNSNIKDLLEKINDEPVAAAGGGGSNKKIKTAVGNALGNALRKALGNATQEKP